MSTAATIKCPHFLPILKDIHFLESNKTLEQFLADSGAGIDLKGKSDCETAQLTGTNYQLYYWSSQYYQKKED